MPKSKAEQMINSIPKDKPNLELRVALNWERCGVQVSYNHLKKIYITNKGIEELSKEHQELLKNQVFYMQKYIIALDERIKFLETEEPKIKDNE